MDPKILRLAKEAYRNEYPVEKPPNLTGIFISQQFYILFFTTK